MVGRQTDRLTDSVCHVPARRMAWMSEGCSERRSKKVPGLFLSCSMAPKPVRQGFLLKQQGLELGTTLW